MVLYFSSTGNSEYIAGRIAEALGDTAVSILDADNIVLRAGEKLGFVFPTYFWRLPSVVDEFMEGIGISCEDSEPYIYFVATYGSTCGGTGKYMQRHLKKKGLRLSASFSIKTADNYTIWFDANDKEKIKHALSREATMIVPTTWQIEAGAKGDNMYDKLPMIAVCGSGYFYNKARKTRHFHVEEGCIGCGLCEKICPTAAIELREGKPVWVKESCTLCLGCLHHCPAFAIQYDNKTQKHGQYRHEDFTS